MTGKVLAEGDRGSGSRRQRPLGIGDREKRELKETQKLYLLFNWNDQVISFSAEILSFLHEHIAAKAPELLGRAKGAWHRIEVHSQVIQPQEAGIPADYEAGALLSFEQRDQCGAALHSMKHLHRILINDIIQDFGQTCLRIGIAVKPNDLLNLT